MALVRLGCGDATSGADSRRLARTDRRAVIRALETCRAGNAASAHLAGGTDHTDHTDDPYDALGSVPFDSPRARNRRLTGGLRLTTIPAEPSNRRVLPPRGNRNETKAKVPRLEGKPPSPHGAEHAGRVRDGAPDLPLYAIGVVEFANRHGRYQSQKRFQLGPLVMSITTHSHI